MEDLRTALLALQEMDDDIAGIERKLREFEPELAELEAPLRELAAQIDATSTRLAELRTSARRLEAAAEQKRLRLRGYEERLTRVRNAREEAAVRTELDLFRRAADADDTEALETMELATRTDLKLDELNRQLEKVRAEIAPRREQLESTRSEIGDQLAILRDRRQNLAIRLDPPSLRLYERVRSGRSSTVLAPLTSEGACGHCFNTLPIQEQSEIRDRGVLRRCEGCGVILYAP